MIKGSIAPDKYMNNPKHFKKYKIKPLTENSLHGKNREKCRKLCENILGKLNKNKRKDAAYLTGIALHTIQDYYAHSYGDMTLAEYKRDVRKYYGKEEYARANAFHLDWAYEYGEKKNNPNVDENDVKLGRKKLHRKNKDNPDMDFDFAKNIWVSVNGDRMKNMRYLMHVMPHMCI